ncbi:MAG: sodium-dependent bicarbonate transport family permease [Chitinophagales bacterium]|nr:sodium-dependent bicarbonate transport family permease [Chitinophagales bacterium]
MTEFKILISNLTNPTLLFFLMGILAARLKSDLEIPATSSKFISLYLLFSIGFRGGQELAHSGFNAEIAYSLLFGLALSVLIPLYTFFLLKQRLSVSDSAAIASSYGSVSAVTFVAAATFLELHKIASGGHMVAVMALMESPAIIVGVILLMEFDKENSYEQINLRTVIHHAFTNGSVLMLLGSMVIGLIADVRQAEGIRPFTTDIFKGFLAIFLLEMGMVAARRFATFRKYGWFVTLFAVFIPAINGCSAAWLSQMVTDEPGNRFMFAILAASASYIAVPAAMRLAAPKADPGLYIPMALGITFPFNITVGFPLYFLLINHT